jgi:heat shock protein HspQ
MRFQVGDLVTTPPQQNGIGMLGVVIKVDKANSSSLNSSVHSSNLLKIAQPIYWVLLSDQTTNGPYYTSELVLKNEV